MIIARIIWKLGICSAMAVALTPTPALASVHPTVGVNVIIDSAGCTPSASDPTLVSGEIIAHGDISCKVQTTYQYQICSQEWKFLPRGGGYWFDLSCSDTISASGSRSVSRTGPCNNDGLNNIYRSELHLWFPGVSEQTAYSGQVGFTC